MFVPFVFTIDLEDSHSFLWVFYKFLDMCRRFGWPIITHEQFLKDPSEFFGTKYNDFINEAGGEYFKYHLPTLSDIEKAHIYPIPKSLVKSAEKHHGGLGKASRALFFEDKPYPPLDELIEKYIEQIKTDYNEPIEGFLTWCGAPFLSRIAKKYNIPVISFELGPLRPPVFRKTAYLETGNLYKSGTLQERYERFAQEGGCPYIFSRKELLALTLLPSSMTEINLCDAKAEYKAGLAWSLSNHNGKRFVSESEIASELMKNFNPSEILFRNRPGSKNEALTEMFCQDDSQSSLDFVSKCERVYSIRSNVAFEAMLMGKPSYILAKEISPFGFMSSNDVSDMTLSSPSMDFTNFVVFSYLVPYEIILEPDYLRWRIAQPSEREIFMCHLMYYLKCRGIPPEVLSVSDGRFEEIMDRQGFDIDGKVTQTMPSGFMLRVGSRFGAEDRVPHILEMYAKDRYSQFLGYRILSAYSDLNKSAQEVSDWALSLKNKLKKYL